MSLKAAQFTNIRTLMEKIISNNNVDQRKFYDKKKSIKIVYVNVCDKNEKVITIKPEVIVGKPKETANEKRETRVQNKTSSYHNNPPTEMSATRASS